MREDIGKNRKEIVKFKAFYYLQQFVPSKEKKKIKLKGLPPVSEVQVSLVTSCFLVTSSLDFITLFSAPWISLHFPASAVFLLPRMLVPSLQSSFDPQLMLVLFGSRLCVLGLLRLFLLCASPKDFLELLYLVGLKGMYNGAVSLFQVRWLFQVPHCSFTCLANLFHIAIIKDE